MNCPNCNNPIESGSDFCGNCGHRLSPVSEVQNQQAPQKSTKQVKISKDKLKKIIIAVVCVAVVAIVGGIIIISATSNVNLNDYIREDVEFEGANGYGSFESTGLSAFIDTEALVDDTQKQFSEKEYNKESFWDELTEDVFYSITDYMEVELPENNGSLSNGDEIEVVIRIDKDGIKKNKNIIKGIKGGEEVKLKFTVSELPECVNIDVFDAVESFTYNLAENNRTTIALKEDYVKDYENGINVRVEGNYIKVYGDEFNSFTVGVKAVTDNIHEDTKSIKLAISCEPDEHLDKGIIISPSEKEVDVTVVSWIKDGSFNNADIKALKAEADKTIKEFVTNAKFSEADFYFYGSGYSLSSMLIFYYTDGEKTYVMYYDDLKKDNNGNVYNLSDQKVSYSKSWWDGTLYSCDNIKAFEDGSITFDSKTNVTIPA